MPAEDAQALGITVARFLLFSAAVMDWLTLAFGDVDLKEVFSHLLLPIGAFMLALPIADRELRRQAL